MSPWDEDDKGLWLLTPGEFEQMPNGVEFESINGEKKTKGRDEIDQDTRLGHLAWGVRDPYNHSEKHILLTFALKR